MTMIVPRPTSVVPADGEFIVDDTTVIHASEALGEISAWLQSALRASTRLPLHEGAAAPGEHSISLAVAADLPPEGYQLTVGPAEVSVRGGDAAGVFHGAQTLLQLLPPDVYRKAASEKARWVIPAVTVTDSPRFQWRGTMLDVARHFVPKHDVLRFIDLMAVHKLNVLHWHLTEDQGWRIEIKQYPRLTTVGAWRRESQVGAQVDAPGDGRPHGGFYTQDDIREIVAYAGARFIEVVPEIDVPGHSQAAIAAYPFLGIDGDRAQLEVATRWGIIYDVLGMEDTTVEFYKNVFDEVMDLFPSRWIGVGGDECPKDRWHEDPRTQELMRQRGLADEEELQTWFIRQLDDHITARGRRLYGWDEILEGELAPGATVASWRGMVGAITAARRGHDVVACPDDQVYLDYRQSEGPDEPIPVAIPLTLEDVYAFEPVPAELTAEEAAHVLGGQANIWTEHMDSPRTIDFMAFPRLCAVAEALWSAGPRDFADFEGRLTEHLRRLDALGVEYRAATGPHPWQTRPGIPGRPSTREERAAYIDAITANILV